MSDILSQPQCVKAEIITVSNESALLNKPSKCWYHTVTLHANVLAISRKSADLISCALISTKGEENFFMLQKNIIWSQIYL